MTVDLELLKVIQVTSLKIYVSPVTEKLQSASGDSNAIT